MTNDEDGIGLFDFLAGWSLDFRNAMLPTTDSTG